MIGWIGVASLVLLGIAWVRERVSSRERELVLTDEHRRGDLLPTPGVFVTFWDGGRAKIVSTLSSRHGAFNADGSKRMTGPAVELAPIGRPEDAYWLSARDFWGRAMRVGKLRVVRPADPPAA